MLTGIIPVHDKVSSVPLRQRQSLLLTIGHHQLDLPVEQEQIIN